VTGNLSRRLSVLESAVVSGGVPNEAAFQKASAIISREFALRGWRLNPALDDFPPMKFRPLNDEERAFLADFDAGAGAAARATIERWRRAGGYYTPAAIAERQAARERYRKHEAELPEMLRRNTAKTRGEL
jgi:hypothetical protein